jgi:hypothetical protein
MNNPSCEQEWQRKSSAPATVAAQSSVPAVEQAALFAGMAFLDATASEPFDSGRIAAWLEEHVVANGLMPRPLFLVEPTVGCRALHPRSALAAADLARLVSTARGRVIAALQGFIGFPSQDRFLREAIFRGRVARERGRWVPRLDVTTSLSDVVLSFFAVAILSDRGVYERELCVCHTCGRVSFDAASPTRATCPTHTPRESGFTRRVTLKSIVAVAR